MVGVGVFPAGLRRIARLATIVLVVPCGAALAPAQAADFPPPPPMEPAPVPPVAYNPVPVPPYVPGNQFEARLGPYAAGIGSAEQGTFDINGSILTPRLNLGLPGYWAYALPRLRVGGAVNVDGRTSFAYADIAFTLPITNWFFFEPFIGGAIHNGSLTPTPTLAGLGCPYLFHAGFTGGFPITEHWSVLGTFEHLSNGRGIFGVNCGTNQVQGGNQGLNNYGISVGYAF
jgi:hypothetical protein